MAVEPELRQDGKKEVYLSTFLTIQEISVPDQSFTIQGWFNMFWRDPSAAEHYTEMEGWSMPSDKVPLLPSNVFDAADSEEMNEDPKFFYDPETHVVHMIYNITATVHEYMELERFPFDRQMLNLAFTGIRKDYLWLADCPEWVPPSPFEDITWDAPMHVRLSEALMSQYNLYSAYVDYRREPFMRFRFRLERRVGYYLSNLVLPMFLIVAICFASFAVHREDIADRLSVSVTMFLAAVAYQYVVGSMLPVTSTLSIMSAYVMTSFTVIGLIVVDNAIAGLLSEENGSLLDQVFAVALGVLWTGVNLGLAIAGLRLCGGAFNLRQDWKKVAKADDSSKAWNHLDKDDRHTIHRSGRWVLCDPDHITKTSNSPHEKDALLESIRIDARERDFRDYKDVDKLSDSSQSVENKNKKNRSKDADEVELLRV